jgi:D-alanine-D-alanine ligase-like ATP-grasp enzyme
MLKKIVDNLDCNVYLNAAEQLGYEIQVMNSRIGFASITNGTKTLNIYKNALSVNTAVQRHFSTDKFLSNEFLKSKFDQWFPETMFFTEEDENIIAQIINFSKKKQGEIVIKPNKKSLGIGVKVKPKSAQEIKLAVRHIFEGLKTDELIVQEFIQGDFEYRVVLCNGCFLDALRRVPAFVTGDGRRSIKQLVSEKNKKRDQFNFKLIKVDKVVTTHLRERGMDLKSVPVKDKVVFLRKTCNMAQGGEVYRVKPAKEYVDLFEKIARVSSLAHIGLDFIGPDISKTFKSSGAFNEINYSPMIDVHYFADLKEGEPLKTSKKLLKIFFNS